MDRHNDSIKGFRSEASSASLAGVLCIVLQKAKMIQCEKKGGEYLVKGGMRRCLFDGTDSLVLRKSRIVLKGGKR